MLIERRRCVFLVLHSWDPKKAMGKIRAIPMGTILRKEVVREIIRS